MSFDNIYESLNKELSQVSDKKFRSVNKSNISTEDWSTRATAGNECYSRPVTLEESNIGETLSAPKINYDFESQIRTLFKKPIKSIDNRKIGCHPDFKNLEKNESNLVMGYTITLFMDIIGSTKLGVIYQPDEVFFIKNSVIKCAIETINAFDGHVHRIMGDAVMAFFRSNDAKSHMDSAIDAINCATYLIQMIKQFVQPNLEEKLGSENIGIRIGIDYGRNEDVVWGYYGHGLINEVTATSFFVDAAAKLQQKAPKNSLMIGQSIKELLGLDNEHYKIKESNSNEKDYYLTPNYIGSDGHKINYKQFVFDTKKYFLQLPGANSKLNKDKRIKIDVKIRDSRHAPNGIPYERCTSSIPKNKYLYIHIEFDPRHQLNTDCLQFKCDVYNTGDEARAANPETLDNHTTLIKDIKINHDTGRYSANHFEHTSYKGLHKIIVSVIIDNKVVEQDEYSIFIN
ncbi:TPA: hypothetical protein KEV54_002757 [Proteus mirabilis]|nr:hypothetical protein [Proteus mirabilis]